MKYVLLFPLFCICKILTGQNLVVNSSFEDINHCFELRQPCSPAGWFYINQKPKGYSRSTMSSADGKKHLTLIVFDTLSVHRDYWQTKLLCSLQTGEEYRITFKVASASKKFSLHNLGFYFTDSFFRMVSDTILHRNDIVSFANAKTKKRRNGWYEVEIDFTAQRNFTHLVIGNFSNNNSQAQLSAENQLSRWVYMAIDEITISPKNKVHCPGKEMVKDSLYSVKSRHTQLHIPGLTNPTPAAGNDTIVINNIEFDLDKSDIKNEDSLRYLQTYLMDTTIKLVRIVGFTDDTGTASYNMRLSLNRAEAVRTYLKEKLHISLPMVAEGRGISDRFRDRSLNRRVEIWIYR